MNEPNWAGGREPGRAETKVISLIFNSLFPSSVSFLPPKIFTFWHCLPIPLSYESRLLEDLFSECRPAHIPCKVQGHGAQRWTSLGPSPPSAYSLPKCLGWYAIIGKFYTEMFLPVFF